MLDVKFACAPILWRGVPFEQIAREAADIGFDGIEAPVRRYRDNIDDLRRILGETGLSVAGAYVGGYYVDPQRRNDEILAAVEAARLLEQVGGRYLISAPDGLKKERKAYGLAEYRAFCGALDEIGKRAADYGVTQVFHNHAWTFIESRLEVDIVCEYTDPRYLKMGFDTGHLYLGWADPVEVVEAYAERVAYLHFKDVRGRATDQPGKATVEDCWVELGAGEVDLAGIVRALDRRGYAGWLSYEQDRTTKTPKESATESLAHARNLVRSVS